MAKFKIPNRDQLFMLMNVDMNSVAPIGSALWTINKMIESLDTSEIEKQYVLEEWKPGREPFHPKTILKVCLYAIYNCRFSLRKMEQDTNFHLGYKFLTGNETINYTTIGKFLIKFKDSVIELFSQTVVVCAENDLIEFDLLGIDSVKLKANASYKQTRNLKSIGKEERKIKERLKEIINNVERDDLDEKERMTLEYREGKLDKAKKILEERVKKASENKSEIAVKKIAEKLKINITDNDAHIMEQRNGERNPAYSVTTTADSKNDIITHFQVNEQDNDSKVLKPAIEGSEEKTGERHETVTADSGFGSYDNLEILEAEGINGLIPDRRQKVEDRGELAKGKYDKSNFEFDKENNNYICPEGKILEWQGAVEVEGRIKDKYYSEKACSDCANKGECTKAEVRIIMRDVNEEVRDRMREKLSEEKNKELYNQRGHVCEAPYGNFKQNWKVLNAMRRGRTKVMMEFALIFMLHNILKLAPILSSG
jgi:transposase